jgi:N utilization substance protein B
VTDPRHTTRVLVFQCLCLLDAQGAEALPMLGRFLDEHAPDADAVVKAESLARRIWRQRAELDEKVGAAAEHWSVARMKAVDRSILRLGVFEILDPDVPAAVAINEAVEIAKGFGSAESPGFVNGILDGIRKAVEAESAAAENADEPASTEPDTEPSE